MLRTMPIVSKQQMIRDEFERVGPMTTQAFARHCIDVGIWDADEIGAFAVRAAQAQIRLALKAPDATGLPFAGPTMARGDAEEEAESEEPGGASRWAQRSFWAYDDYALNIREAIKQRNILDFHARELANECRDRFGIAPDVSIITAN